MLKSSLHLKDGNPRTQRAEQSSYDDTSLLSPIEKLKGASATIIKPLAALGIRTVYDLLMHVPFRYDDFSKKVSIADVKAGAVATISGKLERVESAHTWKRRMHLTEAVISDGTGSMRAVWFNQPFLTKNLRVGRMVNLSGKITADKTSLVLQNPAYEFVAKDGVATHTGRLVPVYRETAGITSRWLRYLMKNALPFISHITDPLPQDTLRRHRLPALGAALREIHFPRTKEESARARKRLAFEELFFLHLLALEAKNAVKKESAPPLALDLEAVKRFVSLLPFRLTDAQRRAAWEILKDMQKPFPMNRLLQGEVGSGKTVVAAIAALNAARNGWQIALMAPTEVLALQHFSVFAQFFALFGCDVGLLTGAQAIVHDGELRADRKMKKQDVIQMIAQGALPVVVGTHALISKNCVFRKLGLVVLDEQHRFGVKQRAALVKTSRVGAAPHLLSMTATPIPRTLALTLYGDLDISLLDEMPKERKKVITKIVLPAHRQAAYAFIRKQAKEGRQIFVICPRIEVGSELSPATVRQFLSAEVKTVKEEYRKLSAEMFPDLRVVMLHGKMKAKEKEETMKKFKNGGADILVSTSVVEVGIDVPNATVMMVEGAELFGLAQLHQFRGRVGRGEHQSYCLLFSGNPRTQRAEQSSYDDNPRTQRAEQSSYDGSAAPEENRRLKALLESHSGFALAEKDLALRGPGDFLGTRQWGLPDLAMASLADAALVKETRDEALRIMKEDPSLEGHPLLKRYLRERAAKVHPE